MKAYRRSCVLTAKLWCKLLCFGSCLKYWSQFSVLKKKIPEGHFQNLWQDVFLERDESNRASCNLNHTVCWYSFSGSYFKIIGQTDKFFFRLIKLHLTNYLANIVELIIDHFILAQWTITVQASALFFEWSAWAKLSSFSSSSSGTWKTHSPNDSPLSRSK